MVLRPTEWQANCPAPLCAPGLTVTAYLPFINSQLCRVGAQRPACKEPLWINKLSLLGGRETSAALLRQMETVFWLVTGRKGKHAQESRSQWLQDKSILSWCVLIFQFCQWALSALWWVPSVISYISQNAFHLTQECEVCLVLCVTRKNHNHHQSPQWFPSWAESETGFYWKHNLTCSCTEQSRLFLLLWV